MNETEKPSERVRLIEKPDKNPAIHVKSSNYHLFVRKVLVKGKDTHKMCTINVNEYTGGDPAYQKVAVFWLSHTDLKAFLVHLSTLSLGW